MTVLQKVHEQPLIYSGYARGVHAHFTGGGSGLDFADTHLLVPFKSHICIVISKYFSSYSALRANSHLFVKYIIW